MTTKKNLTKKLSYENFGQEKRIKDLFSKGLYMSAFTETEKMFTNFLKQYIKNSNLKQQYFDPKNYEILLNELKEYKKQPSLPYNKKTPHQFHKEIIEICTSRLTTIVLYNSNINDNYEEKTEKLLDKL